MKQTRFNEEQIIAVLREQEGGMKTADVCCKHDISSATLYAWKATCGGMDASLSGVRVAPSSAPSSLPGNASALATPAVEGSGRSCQTNVAGQERAC